MAMQQKTLRDLRAGESGEIAALTGKGALRRRLEDMGFTAGCPVLVRRVAPLGDPMQISLRGCELALRRGDAANILLR